MDVARRRGATVLPEVGRVSIAHHPLLERTRHGESGESVRRDGKGKGEGQGQAKSNLIKPSMGPAPALPQSPGSCLRKRRGGGLAQTSRGEGWGFANEKHSVSGKVPHTHKLLCAEVCAVVEGAVKSTQDTYIQAVSPHPRSPGYHSQSRSHSEPISLLAIPINRTRSP